MTDIIKIVALFIFCNGAGCNCSKDPNGGSVSVEQIFLGLIIYVIAVLIERYEPKNTE